MMAEDQLWNGFVGSAGRPLSAECRDAFRNKCVLITGAGGFIGSEIARTAATLAVRRLVLLDAAEHGLYLLNEDLLRLPGVPEFELVLGSVCDRALLAEIFESHKPELVYHAAALKHVPLLEGNPFAAAEVNVIGTRNVVDLASLHHAEQMILLSTDKAVDPIGIMGATKRVAELIVLANSAATRTKALRLCNVIGSSGSVAPLFRRQIEERGPVTITASEATRFFLPLRDAVDALISAAAHEFATGLAIPCVGAPRRIEELAAYLMNRTEHEDAVCGPARVVYTGLRPGEKLHEQMTSSREEVVDARHETGGPVLLDVRSPDSSGGELDESVRKIAGSIEARDLAELLRAIRHAVPEYTPDASLLEAAERRQGQVR